MFTALGMEVTLVAADGRLLSFLDGEISELLAQTFSGMGMRLVLGAGKAAVTRDGEVLRMTLASGEHITPDKVLFAAGRAGNTEGLGLEDVGVQVDERNRIVVDETFRTTADWLYAAGDVIGPPALASVSMEQGRVAACYARFRRGGPYSRQGRSNRSRWPMPWPTQVIRRAIKCGSPPSSSVAYAPCSRCRCSRKAR